MNAKYKVEIWEFERGWGRRLEGVHYFDALVDARSFQDRFNARNTEASAPDWYMQADDPVLVDMDNE